MNHSVVKSDPRSSQCDQVGLLRRVDSCRRRTCSMPPCCLPFVACRPVVDCGTDASSGAAPAVLRLATAASQCSKADGCELQGWPSRCHHIWARLRRHRQQGSVVVTLPAPARAIRSIGGSNSSSWLPCNAATGLLTDGRCQEQQEQRGR